MPRTRSSKGDSAEAKDVPSSKSSSTKYVLESTSENPPNLFILPKKATKEARIVTLPNPRSSKPSRYLVCPQTGFYEWTKISAPKTTPRSWLIESRGGYSKEEAHGQMISSADLFIATPIDPIFLILPALAHKETKRDSEEQKRLFLCLHDHVENLSSEGSHLSEILQWEKTRKLVESRLGEVCDSVDAGGDDMFRLNEKKLVGELLNKARKMSSQGLPPSMEEKFVTKALEAPIQVQKSAAENHDTNGDTVANSGNSTPQPGSVESQSSTVTDNSGTTAASQPSTAATSFVEDANELVSATKASDEVTRLQRIRVAFNFISSRYVSPSLTKQLSSILTDESAGGISFAPLDQYLTELAKLRAEAAASRAIGDYTGKRGRDDEEEEARAEKKRKLEEEKKKKASESRATKDLKKVNTSGMMKLSHFFKKK